MIQIFIALLISICHPEPILLQSTIDFARIIGLPRLKTMDKLFATKEWVGTFGDEVEYMAYSRKKFLIYYVSSRRDS